MTDPEAPQNTRLSFRMPASGSLDGRRSGPHEEHFFESRPGAGELGRADRRIDSFREGCQLDRSEELAGRIVVKSQIESRGANCFAAARSDEKQAAD